MCSPVATKPSKPLGCETGPASGRSDAHPPSTVWRFNVAIAPLIPQTAVEGAGPTRARSTGDHGVGDDQPHDRDRGEQPDQHDQARVIASVHSRAPFVWPSPILAAAGPECQVEGTVNGPERANGLPAPTPNGLPARVDVDPLLVALPVQLGDRGAVHANLLIESLV